MQYTIPHKSACRHRQALEVAIHALQEQAMLMARHAPAGQDSDAQRVAEEINAATVALGRAGAYLLYYCPDRNLYQAGIWKRFKQAVSLVSSLFHKH